MKTFAFLSLSLLSLCFSIASCKKAPGVIRFGQSDPVESDPGTDPDPEVPTGTADLKAPTEYSIFEAECEAKASVRGVRQWRRLSNAEVENTTVSVFGAINGLDYGFVSDIPRRELYDNLMIQANYVDLSRLKSYQNFAAAVAEKVDLSKVLPCFKDGASCIPTSFAALAQKAWRRPLTTAETQSFTALFNSLIASKFTSEQSMRFLIEALVQSESFLYRSELGEKKTNGTYQLTSWEVASALSYGLTRRPPDDTLVALAKANKLQDSASIKAQATRLIESDPGKEAMRSFASMWLGSKKITSLKKESTFWTNEVRNAASAEIEDLFLDSFYTKGKGLKNLLSATSLKSSMADSNVYGAKSESNVIKYSQTERRGLLGSASFLASNAISDAPSPVQRGVYIMTRLLCTEFEPPTEVPVDSPKTGQTNKDRFIVYEGCGGACHKSMDQFGFALENFDRDGIFIKEEGGKAIVTDSLVSIDQNEVEIKSPQALALAIANSDQLLSCYARHVFRFEYGRQERVPSEMVGPVSTKFSPTTVSEADRCEIQKIAKAVKDADGDMKAGIIEAFTNEGFLTRVPSLAK